MACLYYTVRHCCMALSDNQIMKLQMKSDQEQSIGLEKASGFVKNYILNRKRHLQCLLIVSFVLSPGLTSIFELGYKCQKFSLQTKIHVIFSKFLHCGRSGESHLKLFLFCFIHIAFNFQEAKHKLVSLPL